MALTKIPGNLIQSGAITAAALDNDAVTTAKILDANITHAKLHTSMDLTGKTVTVATAAGSTNTTAAASTAFVQQELTTLIGGAPGTLDTLNELAAAINDDDDYHTTLTTALATKLPLAGGSLTGALNTTGRVNLTDNNSISESYVQLGITNTVSSAGLFLHANSGTGKKYEIQSTADGKLIVYDRTSGAYRIQLLSTGELTVAGNIDTAGLLKVGGNDSEYANNYIRFKPTGAAYIDHNTVGQDINFRTSASSSLDRTPLVVQSGGILVTGSVNVSSNVIQSTGNQHVIGVWGTSGLQLIGQTGADNLVGSMGANEPLVFRTGSSERARIDASGNLMVGAGSTSTRVVITPDAVFQSYYSTETTSRIHLGRDVGIGGGAGVAFGGQGGYSLIGTDNTSGTNLYFNAGSNAVGNLTTGHQMVINGATNVVGISSGLFESRSASGGGQIGLGDWSNTNPIGISEGLWNTVGSDSDFVTVYARQHFNVRGYSGGTTHWLSLNATNMTLQQNQKLQVGSLKLINAGIYTENHVGVYAGGVTVNAATSATGWLMSAGTGRLSWDPTGVNITGVLNAPTIDHGETNIGAPDTANHVTGTRQTYYDSSATAWYARGIEGNTLWDNVDHDWKLYRQAALRLHWNESAGTFSVNHGTPIVRLADTSSSGAMEMKVDGIAAYVTNKSTNGGLYLQTNNPRDQYVHINGTAFYSESFALNNGTQYDFEIDVGSEGGSGNSFFVIAGYNHYYSTTYGAHKIAFMSARTVSMQTMINVGDQSSAGGGAWQFTKPSSGILRVRKTAGTYVGGGHGFITVIFKAL